MDRTRIVFMGTPDFAVPCLAMLLTEGYDVVGVVTQPDRPKGRGKKLTPSPVKEFALTHNLPVYTPEKIKDPAFKTELFALKPDLIIVVAFGQFLQEDVLALPPLGCINVHGSLLPYYRGAAPIHWALINGETKTGITTMYMDKGMDTGDMILKEELPIHTDDTTEVLHDKLQAMGAQLLAKTIKLIIDGTAPRTAQNHDIATYASLLTREIEHIAWQKSAIEIHNLVRGLNSWPGAYCVHQGKGLKIWRTAPVADGTTKQAPGTIVSLTSDNIIVQTGEGLIELLEVQPESKKRMSAADYIKGYGVSIGDVLG